jgi:hypothetical protein
VELVEVDGLVAALALLWAAVVAAFTALDPGQLHALGWPAGALQPAGRARAPCGR